MDKNEFLELVLNIAAKVKNENFSFGFQWDPDELYYPIIYYFQFGDKQVSFHSNYEKEGVPKFQGQWIGYRNESFPFKTIGK